MLFDIAIGLLISLIVAYLAYLKKSLTIDGLITATILGAVIYAFGSIVVWSSLILFFISSSLITKIHEKKEKSKSNGRNYVQVLANSFIASLFSVLFYFSKSNVFLVAAVISIASSNSDTWASEIGILSKGKTYSILNFKVVEKGLSGAISSLGTAASFLGSLFIGFVFFILYGIYFGFTNTLYFYTVVVSIGGFVGCFIDSYLGALVQGKYKGVKSGRITEQPFLEGEKVVLSSGFRFITNDLVNFLSGLFSTAVSMLVLII